jgi:hypothetical protein
MPSTRVSAAPRQIKLAYPEMDAVTIVYGGSPEACPSRSQAWQVIQSSVSPLHPSQQTLAGIPRRGSLGRVGPGEFHPEPLTDPDLTLSRHPTRATARRLPPSIEYRVPPVAG